MGKNKQTENKTRTKILVSVLLMLLVHTKVNSPITSNTSLNYINCRGNRNWGNSRLFCLPAPSTNKCPPLFDLFKLQTSNGSGRYYQFYHHQFTTASFKFSFSHVGLQYTVFTRFKVFPFPFCFLCISRSLTHDIL